MDARQIRLLPAITAMCVSALFLLIPSPVFAQEDLYTDTEKRLAAISINYVQDSLHTIIRSRDRAVLDAEYHRVLNRIDRSKVNDHRIAELLSELLDALVKLRLNADERTELVSRYDRTVSRAWYRLIEEGCALARIVPLDTLPHPAAQALNYACLAVAHPGFQAFVRNQRGKEGGSAPSVTRLNDENLLALHAMRKALFRLSIDLVRTYDIPGRWILNEELLTEYQDILDDDNPDRRFRRLLYRSKDFDAYPPYWYQLGHAALTSGRETEARAAFDKFEAVRCGFLRVDDLYTSMLMQRIVLMDPEADRDAILDSLGRLLDETTSDWRKNYFAALVYARYGNFAQAKELLRLNVDEGRSVSLNMRQLGVLLIMEHDHQGLGDLIERMAADERVRHQDVVYLLAHATDLDPETLRHVPVGNVSFTVERSIGKDDIVIRVPRQWLLDDEAATDVQLVLAGETFTGPQAEPAEDPAMVRYRFAEVMHAMDALADDSPLPATLRIVHPSGAVSFLAELHRVCDEENWLNWASDLARCAPEATVRTLRTRSATFTIEPNGTLTAASVNIAPQAAARTP